MYGNERVIKRIVKLDGGEMISPSAAVRPLNLAGEGNEEEKKAALLSPTTNLHRSSSNQFLSAGHQQPEPVAITPTQNGTSRVFQVFSAGIGFAGATLQRALADPQTLDQICRLPQLGIFRADINTFKDNVMRAFKNRKWWELEINGVKIFEGLHPFEEANLGSTMSADPVNFDPEMIDAALAFARQQKSRSATEFVEVVQHVGTYVAENAPNPIVKNLLLTDLKNPKSKTCQDMAARFVKLRPVAITYHFYRYMDESRELSQFEEHLKICRELFGEEVNSNNAIFSETSADTVTVTYLDEKEVAYALVIESIPHETEYQYFKATVSLLDA